MDRQMFVEFLHILKTARIQLLFTVKMKFRNILFLNNSFSDSYILKFALFLFVEDYSKTTLKRIQKFLQVCNVFSILIDLKLSFSIFCKQI